jgi:hypothetical protein
MEYSEVYAGIFLHFHTENMTPQSIPLFQEIKTQPRDAYIALVIILSFVANSSCFFQLSFRPSRICDLQRRVFQHTFFEVR